uniref:Uncharacterized protein n=1 Tax=Parascaris equorum TaxID=6256 RepID=A0A914RMG4_PAREQ
MKILENYCEESPSTVVILIEVILTLVVFIPRSTIVQLLCTLLGMWLIPVFVCVQRQWWRFLVTWVFYSLFSTLIWYKATRPQISGTTPRYVVFFEEVFLCLVY